MLCAGDRDLATLLAYPAALRLGHAARLSGLLVAIQDGDGTRLPLFLVHPDNGQAGPYCQLAHALGEEFAVFGIQADGLYSGAEPRRTVPAMAAAPGRDRHRTAGTTGHHHRVLVGRAAPATGRLADALRELLG